MKPLSYCLISCLFFFAQLQAAPSPNIVFINVDDWGWADAGFQGSEFYETPNIDALADSGIAFRHAYAAAANCAPSRACLLSGLYTPRHGIYTVGNSDRGKSRNRRLIPTKNTTILDDSIVTIAEELKQAGYETVSIGKWHLGPNPLTQGFDINIAGSKAGHPRGYFSPYRNPNLTDGPQGEHLTDRLTTEAIRILQSPRNAPLFLYLPFYCVHTPLQGKADLIAKYQAKGGSKGQGNATYAAMIETLDSNIGRLISAIEAAELRENTMVILTSDNGGIRAVSQQGPLRAGKGSYYEGGIRVPLVVSWPGEIKPKTESSVPVSGIDFYPTLLQVANVESPMNRQLDGQSLLPVLRQSGRLTQRALYWHFPVYLQAYKPGLDGSRDPLFRTRPGSAMRWGNWKLHEYFEDGGIELYDLASDPGETTNLADEQPEKRDQLLAKLNQWRIETAAPVPRQTNPNFRSEPADD